MAARTSAVFNSLLISVLSTVTTLAGVPAGANTPYQVLTSKFLMPLSATVGTSGSIVLRLAEVTAKGFVPGEDVAVATIVAHTDATGTGETRTLIDLDDLPAGSYCIVMTHNHQLDLELTAAILKRNDFTWFGLIGSKTKRVKFEHRLRDRGFDSNVVQRMRCPMGIGEVKGKLPVEIAISIAGEIIATYNACFGQHDAAANAGPIAQLLPPSRRSQAN